jgi:hypothetical protein
LRLLSSPRDAAQAIALAHLLLIEQDGAQSEGDVKAKMNDVVVNVIENWHARSGKARQQ